MKTSFDNWVRVEAVGFSGRIWLFWRDKFQITVLATHPQFLIVRVHYDKMTP